MNEENSPSCQGGANANGAADNAMLGLSDDGRTTSAPGGSLVGSAALNRLKIALRVHGCLPDEGKARCPAHDDNQPSLTYRTADCFSGVVLHCHTGCSIDQVLRALSLTQADLFDRPIDQMRGFAVVAEYVYTDERGSALFIKERREPKDFRLKLPDGRKRIGDVRKVLYRLPEVLAAVAGGRLVYVVEGEADADAINQLGHTATCNFDGAASAGQRSKWRSEYGDMLVGADVVVVADKDAPGRAHAAAIASDLTGKARSVRVVQAATGKDVSDHLAAGRCLDDLQEFDRTVAFHPTPAPPAIGLTRCHEIYARWLGADFDLQALDVVLATAAVEQLQGDPVWLLMVSGSGNAKTETVSALTGAGAHLTSTIASEGALLSGTARKETTRDATGGLLMKIGGRGVLVIKDFTSILSMNRDSRAAVLAALREVYDGRWERNLGTDGGKSLKWEGRIVLVGAVTSAYDDAHAVIASMGDRFALVRVDSNLGRTSAGMQALRNVGNEVEMRAALATAAGGVLAGLQLEAAVLQEDDMSLLMEAADLVTRARTAVLRDFRGQVMEAHQPEMPTRFAKMLGQLVRGALALGLAHPQALAVAMRVAGDSLPPARLLVLGDIMAHPGSRTSDVTKRLQRPRTSIDRTLQELHLLGLLQLDVAEEEAEDGASTKQTWRYSLHPEAKPSVLHNLVTRNVSTGGKGERRTTPDADDRQVAADIPGDPVQTVSMPMFQSGRKHRAPVGEPPPSPSPATSGCGPAGSPVSVAAPLAVVCLDSVRDAEVRESWLTGLRGRLTTTGLRVDVALLTRRLFERARRERHLLGLLREDFLFSESACTSARPWTTADGRDHLTHLGRVSAVEGGSGSMIG